VVLSRWVCRCRKRQAHFYGNLAPLRRGFLCGFSRALHNRLWYCTAVGCPLLVSPREAFIVVLSPAPRRGFCLGRAVQRCSRLAGHHRGMASSRRHGTGQQAHPPPPSAPATTCRGIAVLAAPYAVVRWLWEGRGELAGGCWCEKNRWEPPGAAAQGEAVAELAPVQTGVAAG
jgi:hypothetical protein